MRGPTLVKGPLRRQGGAMETLKIGIGEIVAGIPTILGHEPHDSVVALSIAEFGLPTCAFEIPRAVLLDTDSASVTAAAVAEELAEELGRVVLLVAFAGDDIRAGCPALDALKLEVEFAVPHMEALAVQGGTWFRPGCFEDGCCPRELPAVPERWAAIVASARERAQREREVSEKSLARALHRWETRNFAAEAWEGALADGAVADATTARNLAASLDDLCVRDWVVLTILGAGAEAAEDALEGIETGAVAIALDSALTGRSRPDLLVTERARAVVDRVARAARGRKRQAATNTLAAVLEWWEGNLDAAAERCAIALRHDPSYRLAELVAMTAGRGIAPGWLEQVGQKGH